MADIAYEERGYLTEDFRLFHLNERQKNEIAWHYHTFHKILVLLRGEGAYAIEGERFPLQPDDVIFVGSGCIHRPELNPETDYERYILYISPEYLRRIGNGCDLETCFTHARESGSYVVRPREQYGQLRRLLAELERNPSDAGFGQKLLEEAIFLRLIITLTRAVEESRLRSVPGSSSDRTVPQMLQWIGQNLTEPITADTLAERFSVSKYHMMRKFKAETGCTIHRYLLSKRLLLARELMVEGCSATSACYRSGFQDYTTFSRAYKKEFSVSPKVRM